MRMATQGTASRRNALVFAIQLFLWWGANNLYAIDAHILLRSFPSPLHIELTCAQVLVGLLTSFAIGLLRNRNRSSTDVSTQPPHGQTSWASQTNTRLLLFSISCTHFVGTLLTNASYGRIGSTATLTWKLSEPLTAVLLKQYILKEYTPPIPIFGVLTAVFGVLLFSINSLSLFSVSPIMLANVAFPLRNIFVKYDQKNSHQEISTEQRIFRLYFSSLPFCLLALLCSKSSFELSPGILMSLLRNALLFNTYQFASIAILEQLDAVMHSLANMMKRFCGIVLSLIVLGEVLDLRHGLGLMCAFVGSLLYIMSTSKSNLLWFTRKGIRMDVMVLMCLLLIGTALGTVWSGYDQFGQKTEGYQGDITLQKKPVSAISLPSTRKEIETIPDSEFVILVGKKYRDRPRMAYRTYEDALSYDEDNVGNFVWQYAAVNMLPDFTKSITCNETREMCWRMYGKRTDVQLIDYRPGANYFNRKIHDRFWYDRKSISIFDITPLMIGIGIQEDFDRGMYPDLSPGRKIKIQHNDFNFTEDATAFLSTMQLSNNPMFFRGDFSLEASKRIGYSSGFSTGCPTLMLNENILLGKTLERKYRALEARIGDHSLKVAINIKTPPKFKAFYMRLLDEYPNSVIFSQGLNDTRTLFEDGVPFERVRFYSNVEQWIDGMRDMDVSIGARIHGNMLALGASVPVFVFAPDHRVLELVERMRIPYATFYDEFPTENFDIAKVMFEYGFNGDVFDANRCEIAKIYRREFMRYELEVSRHVKQISELC